jgi:hypothetical protein
MGVMMDSGRMTALVHALVARIINVTKPLENVLRVLLENGSINAPVPAQAARIIYVTRILVNVTMGVLMENGEMTAPKHVQIARTINVCRVLELVLHVRTGKWAKPVVVQKIALPPPRNVA